MSKRINITVSDKVHETLKGISEDYGITISAIVSTAIMSYLEQKQVLQTLSNLDLMNVLKEVQDKENIKNKND